MKTILKILLILLILSAVATAGGFVLRSYLSQQQTRTVFKTESVTKGHVMQTISATGTVEPEELINVGAQVNGKVMAFGKDTDGKAVDYGSKVTKGMILAQIDDVIYKAELQEAEAQKKQAESSIINSEAAIKESEANEVLAKNNWERAQRLYEQKSMTKSDYDSYQAANLVNLALTLKAKAALAQAKASLSIAEANLVKAKRNLEYCTISSPVDGIIIDRRVSIGQTVVSNQTASSIFLVAKDFQKMQVWVAVNEADIGSIQPGMSVQFSCDAFPGTIFRGSVRKLRMNATLSSNVVTYIVEVDADNADRKLVPYLTANVKFILKERCDVLTVQAATLRFRPSNDRLTAPLPSLSDGEGILFVEAPDQKLRPIVVRTGLSNGQLTEISSDELTDGTVVVSGLDTVNVEQSVGGNGNPGADNASTRSPFLPNMPKPPSSGSAAQRERLQNRSAN